MGVVNVTPDSFSDGGRFETPEQAIPHARRLAAEGADILDIGGESTRPGSDPVAPEKELQRILPVLEGLRGHTRIPLSVDTRKARVADAALEAGAAIVNDVTALADPAMAQTVARHGAGLVLMHMKGDPKTMQQAPHYQDVVAEVCTFLDARARRAQAAGIPPDSIAVDPGLGFGKRTGGTAEDNLVLLKYLPRLADLGFPIVVGASRKTFIGNVLKLPVVERLEGSLAAAAFAAWSGAHIVRVHDVKQTRRVVDLVDAIRRA